MSNNTLNNTKSQNTLKTKMRNKNQTYKEY